MKNRENTEINFDVANVANMLKALVNEHCANGEEWYRDVPETFDVNLFDIQMAIRILEKNAKADEGKGTIIFNRG